ncbi:DBH-like monooxygenase protein 1 [Paramyrothecium foliicola]|nr:DBH-like monooxygenase protein 1 [Paramyrothecium foliicola]
MQLFRCISWGLSGSPYFLLSLVFLLGLPVSISAQSTDRHSWIPFDQRQFSGNTTLDVEGDVQLFWEIGHEYSTFGIASRSNGYLALGFSETGAMTGADMAVGYMGENDQFVLENFHAAGFVFPKLSEDQQNNIQLKEGHQHDGVTAFVFQKKNEADCLENQVNVATESWQWFIYAFSNENTFTQHEPGNNGKKYVKLGTGETVSVNEVLAIDNTKNFTIVQPKLTIPIAETTYCYSLHRMPAGQKNYLLGERPTQTSGLLHHLVVYACYGLSDGDLDMVGEEANCDWENFSNPCNGFVTEWAPGMSGRTFEPGYGKPFGEDYYEYVMLETHYNNPEGLEGETDTATFTFLYTDEPVETEIGTLTLGDLQVDGWFLEPGRDLAARSTVCTPECTSQWPSEGITAFSVFHHMHYRGRNARIQIIRDGQEIAPLSSLRDFEYGYQFSKSLNQIQLLPGDKLITTCEYDTSEDSEPVPGGLSSQDEMCFAWVDYYPANNILACTQADMGNSLGNDLERTVTMRTDDVNYCIYYQMLAYRRYEYPSLVVLQLPGEQLSASSLTATILAVDILAVESSASRTGEWTSRATAATTAAAGPGGPPKKSEVLELPQIGDALVRLNVRHGGYLSGLKMFSPGENAGTSKIFGPAYTVRMVAASDSTSPKPVKHFADTIPKGSVVFVSQPEGYISACWGGLMSMRAQKAGAAGVVIDGRFRDINEHHELGISIFARGTSILGSNTFTRSSELNAPLSYQIQELVNEHVEIRPGDIIMGDADGVVAVPPELAEECVNLCESRWNIDEATRRCIGEGEDIGPTIAKLRD